MGEAHAALQAVAAMKAAPEAIDEAKAWTCVTHIISRGGDWAREGYLLTVDDRMYWDRLYSHMAMSDEPPETDASPIDQAPPARDEGSE